MKTQVKTIYGRVASSVAVLIGALVLAGCGPEAPPCTEASVLDTVRDIALQQFEEKLGGKAKPTDMATFALDGAHVTAYDDKLKVRSCTVNLALTLKPDRLKGVQEGMETFGRSVRTLGSLGVPWSSAPQVQQIQSDWAAFQVWNGGPLDAGPIRTKIQYRVQPRDAGRDFEVVASIDPAGIVPLLRTTATVTALRKEYAEQEAKSNAEAEARKAQVERQLASGRWRKPVFIDRFSGYNCYERRKFCFEGRDSLDGHDFMFYEIDAEKVSQADKTAWIDLLRAKKPVCLVNVRKTDQPDRFTFYGWSAVRNDKGELVDCLPGAENTDWDATVAKSRGDVGQGTQIASSSPPTQPVSPAPPAIKTPATQNLTSVIQRYEPCGGEAMCLYTARGNMIVMNVAALGNAGIALLDGHIKSQEPLCLKDVSKDGNEYGAEGVASRC